MRRIILLISFILINIFDLNAQNEYEIISETEVNVRSVPSSRARIVGVLSPSTKIDVIRFAGNWAEFKLDGEFVYVHSKYIRKLYNSSNKGDLFEVISNSRLNIRCQPTTKSKILGTLTPGTQIEVFSINGEWATIPYNDSIAFVSIKYIKNISEKTIDAPSEEIILVDTTKFIDTTIFELKQDSTSVYKSDIWESMTIDFVPNVYLGYANFYSNNVSPKALLGCGIDLGFQFSFIKSIGFIPKDYFAEISFGYSLKGSAAFPLHYLNLKLYPLGYRYNLSEMAFYGKLGLYTGDSFSDIATRYNYFRTNVDFGMIIHLGVEYDNFGIGISYERGFTEVCNSNLSLKNSCVFINVSYRLLSLNKNFKQQLRWKNL